MSNLTRRTSRKDLEKRAYYLVLGTAVAGIATILVLILALIDVTEFSTAFLLALITAALGYGFKRTVDR